MKFSYDWLKEYIDISFSPEKLAEILTMLGMEVENYHKSSDGDLIFELELTSNRPDCANLAGIARELGTALKKRVKYPAFKIREGKEKIGGFVKIEVKDTKLCPRYAARVIRNLKVGLSPAWLSSRLEKMGLRSVNNVVDAANFVLMELGHPLHTFDLDTLSKSRIIVRRAGKGEKIITIDMVERNLSDDILVIADGEKPQAIAGIMGGNLSEVKGSTTNVLLESAYFEKGAIRRAGKKLNIMTEASYRFERGANPEGLIFALDRAAELIRKLAGGEIARGRIDIYKKRIPRLNLELNLEKLNRLLGTGLGSEEVKRIFRRLEFKIKAGTKKKIKVTVPGFRGDIKREIDLIEEAARHYGYDKIKATLPQAAISPPDARPGGLLTRPLTEISFEILEKLGLQEVVNYSFINTDTLLALNLNETVLEKGFIPINNPISSEQDIMRPTLLGGLLGNISRNFNRQRQEVKIFEVGKIFYKEKGTGKITEKTAAAAAITGSFAKSFGRNEPVDLFDLKGMIEAFLKRLGISSFSLLKGSLPCFHPQNSARIIKDGKKAGWWGEINPAVSELLGLQGKIFAAEIILDELSPWVDLSRQFKPLPKFPSIERDLSLLVPETVTSEEITEIIKNEGRDLIAQIELFDVYQGEQVPEGFRSFGYNLTYRSPSKTLTDEQVNDLHRKISRLLENNLKIKIRGG